MKILQINKFFYIKGGSEQYFFDVSSALERAGNTVIPFSMHHPRNADSEYKKYFVDYIDFQDTKTLKKAGHFLYSRQAADRIEQLVKETKPDIAHLHNIAHQLTPSIIHTLKRLGIPMVQTLHDYQLICPNYKLFTQGSPCERCHQHKYWQAVKNKCVQDSYAASALSAAEMGLHNIVLQTYKKGVNQFIAPSKFLHNRLLDWGWNDSQVSYIPHFVDKKRNLDIQKKNQIAYIGRLSKEKGALLLLEAIRHLNDATVEVLFVGEGEEHAAIQEVIAQHNLKQCTLTGFKNREEVDHIIQESRAVIVPSLWYENAPMIVYESLAFGTPVIGSNQGGLPELIQDGKNGYLFEPANPNSLSEAIARVLTHSPLQIPENVYTEALHMQRLLKLYEENRYQKKS